MPDLAERSVPRKKGEKSATGTIQIGFRAPVTLHDRIEKAAERLGLDISGLLRMMILEQLPTYEERGERIHGSTNGGGSTGKK